MSQSKVLTRDMVKKHLTKPGKCLKPLFYLQICAWAGVESTGTSDDTTDAPEDETTDAPEEEDDTSSCDISGLFGTSSITGTYTLRVIINRSRYISYVTCVNSICTPVDTSITDACVYICGSSTC